MRGARVFGCFGSVHRVWTDGAAMSGGPDARCAADRVVGVPFRNQSDALALFPATPRNNKLRRRPPRLPPQSLQGNKQARFRRFCRLSPGGWRLRPAVGCARASAGAICRRSIYTASLTVPLAGRRGSSRRPRRRSVVDIRIGGYRSRFDRTASCEIPVDADDV